MDRYIIRQPGVAAAGDYPQQNRESNAENIIPSDSLYYGGSYRGEYNMQRINTGYMGYAHVNAPTYPANYSAFQPVPNQGQGHIVSGIDPTYLAAYSDNNATFIATGQQVQDRASVVVTNNMSTFGSEYQDRNVMGADRNTGKKIVSRAVTNSDTAQEEVWKSKQFSGYDNNNLKNNVRTKLNFQQTPNVPTTKPPQPEMKNDAQIQVKTRSDKLKALYKSGPRAFSGPVEKVLKWHKSLQNIGVLVFYEIVAKCVNVRAGESCAQNLVVRDENGPAMQVVYYEIDFLLPLLNPPCTVRVIGRMVPGTCRLQAFSVRPANGDDVATLPRRAAVSAHHVDKLCKEYDADV